jgi:hypothetical protein
MNEPALSEAIKTDLPSPKANRRKRLALRFAVLVVAVSALGAAYRFTRPPELVWWRSPEIGHSGRRVSTLIPGGWRQSQPPIAPAVSQEQYQAWYFFRPAEHWPGFLRRLFSLQIEVGVIEIIIDQPPTTKRDLEPEVVREDDRGMSQATRELVDVRSNIFAEIQFSSTNLPAFNRTYRQICNSLTIE